MIKKLDRELLRQLLVFGLIGVSATMTHYFVALFSHQFLHISLYAANLSGYCAAVAISYFGHGRLTFKQELNWQVFSRFVAVSISTLLLSEVLLYALETQFSLHHAISLGIVVCTIPLITFVLSKLWVFRGPANSQQS
jgi:putative flippase GtrA